MPTLARDNQFYETIKKKRLGPIKNKKKKKKVKGPTLGLTILQVGGQQLWLRRKRQKKRLMAGCGSKEHWRNFFFCFTLCGRTLKEQWRTCFTLQQKIERNSEKLASHYGRKLKGRLCFTLRQKITEILKRNSEDTAAENHRNFEKKQWRQCAAENWGGMPFL